MAELLDAVSDEIALADSPTPPRQLLDYGTIDFKLHNTGSAAEFIKVTPRIDKQEIVEIALNSWELEPEPTMLLRICGSDTDRMVEAKEVIEGAIMAASATNAWIFCAGLDFGLPSIVGQVLQQRRHACEAPLIGVVSFASIQKREQLNLNAKGTDVATQGSKRSYTDGEPDPDMSTVSLQPNHTHFVICDQGEGAEVKASRSNVERAQALLDARKRSFTFAHEIERAVSEYEGRCVPRVLLVVCGDATTLTEVLTYTRTVHQGTSCAGVVLLAAETGGLAAALSQFVKGGDVPPMWKTGAIAEQFAELKRLNEEIASRQGDEAGLKGTWQERKEWPLIMCMNDVHMKEVSEVCLDAAMMQAKGQHNKVLSAVRWNAPARLATECKHLRSTRPQPQIHLSFPRPSSWPLLTHICSYRSFSSDAHQDVGPRSGKDLVRGSAISASARAREMRHGSHRA